MSNDIKIARALVQIGAVGFCVQNPITFTSGMKAPVYVDNRKFPFWPDAWHSVIEGFHQEILENNITFDVIAGMETAGIPHSSALAYLLHKPSVFVRKKPKEHGTKSKIEGGNVQGKNVLLIEDLITTGGSSLAGVEALRQEGAEIKNCLVIATYGFKEAADAFEKANVILRALTSFSDLLKIAQEEGRITSQEKAIVESWLKNPYGWGA